MTESEANILTKQRLFRVAARQKRVERHVRQPDSRLKVFQDAAAFAEIVAFARNSGLESVALADVGGDDSRLIPLLQATNHSFDCGIIDTWDESIGSGTTERPVVDDQVRLIECLLGTDRCKELIPDASFDVVTSISVVEHVPVEQLEAFFFDCARICKPGGLVLHHVDIHISDAPESPRGQAYLDSFGSIFGPPSRNVDDWAFRSNYVSNPDDIMFRWGQRGDNMSYRANHQAVDLVLRARKPAMF